MDTQVYSASGRWMEFSPPTNEYLRGIPKGFLNWNHCVGGENNSTPLIAPLHPAALLFPAEIYRQANFKEFLSEFQM